jgi:hypothetical protein
MQKVDLVYVLGSGSIWNNNELRFSLRSVEKNLMGVRNIYVIGENPGFLSDEVIHIYHPDPLDRNADGNMALKILRACREKKLSSDFLFMNDDFIINRPMVACEIPWMHKGDMKQRPRRFWEAQFYRRRLRRTFDILSERGLPTMQYDYHAPMLISKMAFPKVMRQFDFQKEIGYTFRSLYGNYFKLPATPVSKRKVTVYKYYTLEQLNDRIQNTPFVGYNNQGVNSSLKWWFMENFPQRSKYEINRPRDRITDLFTWQKNGMDFKEGVEVFEKYYKHVNLLRLFKTGETTTLKNKLVYKLSRTIKEL